MNIYVSRMNIDRHSSFWGFGTYSREYIFFGELDDIVVAVNHCGLRTFHDWTSVLWLPRARVWSCNVCNCTTSYFCAHYGCLRTAHFVVDCVNIDWTNPALCPFRCCIVDYDLFQLEEGIYRSD